MLVAGFDRLTVANLCDVDENPCFDDGGGGDEMFVLLLLLHPSARSGSEARAPKLEKWHNASLYCTVQNKAAVSLRKNAKKRAILTDQTDKS